MNHTTLHQGVPNACLPLASTQRSCCRGTAPLRRIPTRCTRAGVRDAPGPHSRRRLAAAGEIQGTCSRYRQAAARRCSLFPRRSVGCAPVGLQRIQTGIGVTKLLPLPDHLRRSGRSTDRCHLVSRSLEARILAARAQARRSRAPAELVHGRASLAEAWLCHGALRAGHGAAFLRNRAAHVG